MFKNINIYISLLILIIISLIFYRYYQSFHIKKKTKKKKKNLESFQDFYARGQPKNPFNDPIIREKNKKRPIKILPEKTLGLFSTNLYDLKDPEPNYFNIGNSQFDIDQRKFGFRNL